ncbi:plasmid pRiA4b ORF-3 family protein [Leptodesmis sichuanensis]|uniref:plasmid pRiA4b ORF-3 family protein n=1 Tax=Leptodesmis sichuanensis TaxID=2906798 RepID=UPI001F37031F|nr:plasmid pRiA4b ORF-3 family protein [Leptodesmis sichuanensis A121]
MMSRSTAALCRKRPSPIEKGQSKTWACGITHAIGMVNFLFDSSQNPHISASELYQWFGVSASTGQGKSKLVRDTLKMHQLDPDWCLPSRSQIRCNQAPPEPAQHHVKPPNLNPLKKRSQLVSHLHQPRFRLYMYLYVLDVVLIDGPVTEQFIKKNPQVIRTIEIRGDPTLADLHSAIFKAFDREEEHMYEFQLKGKGPNDPSADRYGLAIALSNDFGSPMAGDVAQTQIGTLGLEVEEPFGYWFDFGDDWWHQVQVTAITAPQPKVKYPQITRRIGASPPQYAEFD